MSANANPFAVGQKVFLLHTSGQVSTKRFEITRVWRYPTTFRYQLDTGYVADHSELRPLEGEAPQGDATTGSLEPPASAEPAVSDA
ncbi:MAG: hypothetical protein IT175_19215 [Acidobacteria bacterium]|nr:hypothetical protein [Acidobacteriota bacterium]